MLPIFMGEDLFYKLEQAVKEGKTFGRNNIYDLGGDVLAKRCSFGFRARNEQRWADFLRENGIKTPKIYGVVHGVPWLLRRFSSQLIKDHDVLMEKIEGERQQHLTGDQAIDSRRQYREALEKAVSLGVNPFDYHGGNALYDSHGHLYLIDFESWSKLRPWKSRKSTIRAIREKIPQ